MSLPPSLTEFENFGDDIAPGFDLAINGQDAGEAASLYTAVRPLIQSVCFEEDEEMASLLELTVINQPATAPGQPVDWRAVIDSKVFSEGNEIDLWIGYGSSRTYMDRTQIVKWMPVFGDDGPVEFTVKAFDGRHPMTIGNQYKAGKQHRSVLTAATQKRHKPRRTFYKNLTDADVAKQVAAKYGYGIDADVPDVKRKRVVDAEGKVHHIFPTRVQPTEMPDWEFLRKLADVNRFDAWVSYNLEKKQYQINFKKRPDIGQAVYTFTYNGEDGSLINASPDFSIKDQPTDVEVLYYDKALRTVKKTVLVESKPAENVSLAGGRVGPGELQAKETLVRGASVRFSAAGQVLEAFSEKPFRNPKEAQAFVTNWLSERERSLVVMQGTVVGIPKVRCRQVHELRGLGARLDGFYRFTNVKHCLRAGSPYLVEFTAYKILTTDAGGRDAQTSTVAV